MKDKNLVIEELLNAWEETYKKGQLTLWVFLALKEERKCVEEIKEFVERMSEGTMSCEEQSLYRNLRKFQHLEIVAYESKKVSKGPDRKYYYLTETGKELFKRFVERNILIFTKESIINLLNH
ncbi:MAG: PadR family transcriptional regulator [Bacteroidaceae bacterium]|nr:PadR family transcriptional regulator [Bacteroidaceae bacterium]